MLDEYLVQTCYLVTATQDRFGDYVESSRVAIPCRFREISSVRRESRAENNDTDAMLWVSSSTGIDRGNTILFEGYYYQVERVVKARALGSTEVRFIKCDLKVISVS